jgi:hypothetical protein
MAFLEVLKHDVVAVAAKLANYFRINGVRLLAANEPFHFTPNQCRCAARRRLLPMAAFVPRHRMAAEPAAYGSPDDLPYLYEFVQHVKHVCVHPKHDPTAGSDEGSLAARAGAVH